MAAACDNDSPQVKATTTFADVFRILDVHGAGEISRHHVGALIQSLQPTAESAAVDAALARIMCAASDPRGPTAGGATETEGGGGGVTESGFVRYFMHVSEGWEPAHVRVLMDRLVRYAEAHRATAVSEAGEWTWNPHPSVVVELCARNPEAYAERFGMQFPPEGCWRRQVHITVDADGLLGAAADVHDSGEDSRCCCNYIRVRVRRPLNMTEGEVECARARLNDMVAGELRDAVLDVAEAHSVPPDVARIVLEALATGGIDLAPLRPRTNVDELE